MKLRIPKYYVLLALTLGLALQGCLKDKMYDQGLIQSQRNRNSSPVIEMPLSATSTANFVQYSFNSVDKDTIIDFIPVTYNAAGPAPRDIHVTLAQSDSLVDAYNNVNGTSYEVPDASQVTIVGGNVVTIPKGSNTGYLRIKINPSHFVGLSPAMGFKIVSADLPGAVISGNTGSGIAAFGVKNKYDGRYIVTGTLVDVLAPANSSVPGDPYPYEIDFVTAGASSVSMLAPGLGFFHRIAGGSVYGEFDPVLTFDANDNIVSVVNLYGQPSPSRKRSAELDPSGANKMNADKSVDVKYFIKQGGALKATVDEHYQYIGPR